MDGSVKLFRLVQKYYQTMGIYPSQTINWRNVIFLFAIFAQFMAISGFFLLQATSIPEYGSSFMGISSSLYSIVTFLLTLWRIPEILKLIQLCENFIEKSTYELNRV